MDIEKKLPKIREGTSEDSVGGAANGCARHTQCGGLMSPVRVIWMLGEISTLHSVLCRFVA